LQDFLNYLKKKKINWIAKEYFSTQRNHQIIEELLDSDENSKLHDEFIENTITNFYIPLGVALIS
jgi:hydroxymethylglutaryl-CoA reductase